MRKKYVKKFKKIEKENKKIISLIEIKKCLSQELSSKESDKFQLIKHFDEMYNLEKDFKQKKQEILAKIEEYKYIVKLHQTLQLLNV